MRAVLELKDMHIQEDVLDTGLGSSRNRKERASGLGYVT